MYVFFSHINKVVLIARDNDDEDRESQMKHVKYGRQAEAGLIRIQGGPFPTLILSLSLSSFVTNKANHEPILFPIIRSEPRP